MEDFDNQNVENVYCRNDAESSRNHALSNRNVAGEDRNAAVKPSSVVNLAQININAVVVSNAATYRNGPFIPVFQDVIRAIACNPDVKPGTRRVLDYLIGTVDEHNCFSEKLSDIAANLGCSVDTVERAIRQLVAMNLICKKEGSRDRSLYELTDKILNPRLAKKGNTSKLSKNDLPTLLDPTNRQPLIPSFFTDPDF